ncbi:Ltp family lipoprotein [Acetobacterium wieringae]|uniref:Ltp family lipoprotein n=1 Tax=Acetobacterium wieringae TaxID=52694 RepID=UPI0026F1566A|nr:Ltp family lipoprotein [Acetobacterium wieringae]
MEENVKVPWWQKTWVVVLACIFVPPAGLALLWIGKKGGMVLRIILTVILGFYSLAWLSGFVGGNKSATVSDQTATKTEIVAEDKSAADKAAADKAAADKAAADKAAAAKPQVTMGQKNALSKAKSYLDFTAFSYSGLISQLEFEGFSTEDATYGADNCGADWNAQAAKKAKSYLDMTSFSRDGLIEQLLFEGFTNEQAEYGVTAVGY